VQAAQSRALAQSRVEGFDRVVSIGDGIWDITTARRLALPFVGIGSDDGSALQRRGATHVMRDLSDVSLLLRCLEEAGVPEG
jgi:phosphoglycolate phosphatase-like HAD superfamily hydrolase